ncbi:MAG: HDOD domain-containing protein [bacterium]|nr:HDOD domain-containing protein [bacterium]
MDREDIRLGIRNIRNLPTLPVIVSRILEVADDSGSSANELAGLVARDMSVSAKVLNLANSAFYGFSRRITTIPQAVVVLGFDTVRSLALSVSVFESLSRNEGDVSFDREAFWIHSIGCGTASRLIAKELGYRDSGTFFVAGLLHDLGKIILDTYFSEQYSEVVKEMVEEERPALEAETDILNIDHAEVGAWLAVRWKFPEILVTPIAAHHNLLAAEEEFVKEAVIVHLANILTKRAGIGLCYETDIAAPSDMVASDLKLTNDQISKIEGDLEGERDQINEFLSYLSG